MLARSANCHSVDQVDMPLHELPKCVITATLGVSLEKLFVVVLGCHHQSSILRNDRESDGFFDFSRWVVALPTQHTCLHWELRAFLQCDAGPTHPGHTNPAERQQLLSAQLFSEKMSAFSVTGGLTEEKNGCARPKRWPRRR